MQLGKDNIVTREKGGSKSDLRKREQSEKNISKETKNIPNKFKKYPKNIYISVIVPFFNEEDSLPELALQLENELRTHFENNYEVILVDDGSNDNSIEVVKQIKSMYPRFKCIRFRRNYGKSAALAAGFNESRGTFVITMDADLQDDPAEIKNLVAKLKEGYDLVSGWKKKRYDPINKTIPSKLFNFVTRLMTGVKIHDFNCGLKAYRNEVAKSLQIYGEMHRYIPALAYWEGFRVTELPVVHHPRRFGKTKFGGSRYIKGFLDLLTLLFTNRYLKRPLHFFGTVGVLFALVGFIINLVLTIEWAIGKTALSNRPLALLGIALIIVGVQFISLGLLGEIIAKNSQKGYIYRVKERI